TGYFDTDNICRVRTPERCFAHAKTPLVLGTPAVASCLTAVRSATASALKDASARWWSLRPRSTSTCRVRRAALANDSKKCVIISHDSSPTLGRTSCRLISLCARLEISTIARDRASSSGTQADPKRAIPARSPSATSKASPSVSAQSSVVWWSSIHVSPLQSSSKSKRLCLARAVSMWSKKPMPELTLDLPVPSSDSLTLIDVSLVTREILASRTPLFPLTVGALLAVGTAGTRSSSSPSPGVSTTEAPTCSNTLPIAAGVCSRIDLAYVCGVKTPYATAPALRPAMMSSTVSPTMAA
ncbi:hypothetical protein PPTG_24745, partial [Phytophthora nicotianae INRA-310]